MDIYSDQTSNIDNICIDEHDIFKSMDLEIDKISSDKNQILKNQLLKKVEQKLCVVKSNYETIIRPIVGPRFWDTLLNIETIMLSILY